MFAFLLTKHFMSYGLLLSFLVVEEEYRSCVKEANTTCKSHAFFLKVQKYCNKISIKSKGNCFTELPFYIIVCVYIYITGL